MLTRPKSDWRTEAEEQLRQAYRDNAKRDQEQYRAAEKEIAEGAARLAAMTEEEKLSLMFRADIRRADRLAALPPLKFADKERQHQGEFTNESANYDEAREAQDHR
jgi:hypothetical protein